MRLSVSVQRTARARGCEPLPAPRKWRAITIATLVLVPAFWAMLAGFVSIAAETRDTESGGAIANPAAAIAFGFAIIPFAFIALAFLSEHPRAPGAVVKAMGLFLLVGIPVSALAGDAVTGLVAGVGAGGLCALRADDDHRLGARWIAVLIASIYTFALARTAGGIVLVSAPIFPLTGLGVADHLSERRRDRDAATASGVRDRA
jgi:hypothetical protein